MRGRLAARMSRVVAPNLHNNSCCPNSQHALCSFLEYFMHARLLGAWCIVWTYLAVSPAAKRSHAPTDTPAREHVHCKRALHGKDINRVHFAFAAEVWGFC